MICKKGIHDLGYWVIWNRYFRSKAGISFRYHRFLYWFSLVLFVTLFVSFISRGQGSIHSASAQQSLNVSERINEVDKNLVSVTCRTDYPLNVFGSREEIMLGNPGTGHGTGEGSGQGEDRTGEGGRQGEGGNGEGEKNGDGGKERQGDGAAESGNHSGDSDSGKRERREVARSGPIDQVVAGVVVISSVSVTSLSFIQSAVSYSYSSFSWYLRNLSGFWKSRKDKAWFISIAGILERISKENVMKNRTRREILDVIHQDGPMHFRDIMRSTGMTPNRTKYHLFVLERFGMVTRRQIGKFLVYSSSRKTQESDVIHFAMKNPSRRRIISYLLEHGESGASEIARYVNLTRSTVRYHLAQLQKMHIVKTSSQGIYGIVPIPLDS